MDDDLTVPIEVREHEKGQLQRMVPAVQQQLERANMDEDAAQFERINENIQDLQYADGRGGTLSMPVEDWTALGREIDRVTDEYGTNRVTWLRDKLLRRLRDRMEDLQ